MQFSADQELAIQTMQSGASVFLTGGAGTGKTATIKEFLRRSSGLKVAQLATTAAAAQLIGGQTLHSFFRLQHGVCQPTDPKPDMRMRTKLKSFSTILIEEVSMLRIDQMQSIRDKIFASARGYGDFAGYQLIMVGDFAQLPPVLTEAERHPVETLFGQDSVYSFQTKIWDKLKVCELTTIHRQAGDLKFAKWLHGLRAGEPVDLSVINDRLGSSSPDAVNLVATNRMADRINSEEMEKIRAGVYRMEGQVKRNFNPRDMRVPESMALKPGSRVILCANNKNAGYVNGDSGTFLSAARDASGHPVAQVRLDRGPVVTVVRHKWESVVYDTTNVSGDRGQPSAVHAGGSFGQRIIGTYEQLPILPGWAITIHRSQGMSLNRVHLDPRGMFESGQAYVALSRVTSLRGLTLEAPIEMEHIMTDPRVVEYHDRVLGKSVDMVFGEPSSDADLALPLKANAGFRAKLVGMDDVDRSGPGKSVVFAGFRRPGLELPEPEVAPIKADEYDLDAMMQGEIDFG